MRGGVASADVGGVRGGLVRRSNPGTHTAGAEAFPRDPARHCRSPARSGGRMRPAMGDSWARRRIPASGGQINTPDATRATQPGPAGAGPGPWTSPLTWMRAGLLSSTARWARGSRASSWAARRARGPGRTWRPRLPWRSWEAGRPGGTRGPGLTGNHHGRVARRAGRRHGDVDVAVGGRRGSRRPPEEV